MTAIFVFPPAVPFLGAADIAVGAASLWINYEQGDTVGMFFDVVGLGFGVAPAFKGAFNWLRQGDDVARGRCTMLRRLIGDGCFRGTTITYRLVDVDNDFESPVAEVKPMLVPADDQSGAMVACLLIGVGGFAWQRQRKRRRVEEDERQAIDSVFGESPRDDAMWT